VKNIVIESASVGQSEKLGRLLGRALADGGHVGLVGSLGAGKTVIARSILRGFGIRLPAPSPTFTLVHRFDGPRPAYHVDLYRLSHPSELIEIGWSEIVAENALVIVEWFDRFPDLFPGPHLGIRIGWPQIKLRRIELEADGGYYESAVKTLKTELELS
jgi:tRNA threonylcarbamoyladenosine biosynthesis protein TsaE